MWRGWKTEPSRQSPPVELQAASSAHTEFVVCDCTIEEYHQCLKSGYRIEERQLQTVDALMRLLGVLSPLAVRLLQVRAYAREAPQRPASEVIEPLMLAVLAQRSGHSPATMTLGTFWTEVARLGGYLARRRDGPPGWRTIWKGWLSLQTLLEGAHLALHLHL
ncbi:hypothetical protein KSC_102560 [Ktedonobacter sp. SOSP1-52]|nr:hypothetical protein KSC_102560 [Ktedonobacter sp. SOSP1-52]